MLFSFKRVVLGEQELLEKIIKIDQDLFPRPWSRESFLKQIELEANFLFALQGDDAVISFAFFNLDEIEGLSHLYKIFVMPDHRKKGLARETLKRSYTYMQKAGAELDVFLEVEESNVSAIRLYERIGLKRVHLSKNFYGDGQHAVIMKGKPCF